MRVILGKVQMQQLTFTEKELAGVMRCSPRRIYELRKIGVLKGTKVGKSYIYFYKEIERLFEEYEGRDFPKTKKESSSSRQLNGSQK